MGCLRHHIAVAFVVLIAGSATAEAADEPAIIDVHAHLQAGKRADDLAGAAASARDTMDQHNIALTLVMPPPQTVGQGHDERLESYGGLLPGGSGGPFAFLGGGGSLNVMIQQALRAGGVTEALKARFRARAEAILAKGAIGFGEMTAEHVSRRAGHPYVAAPPDHPLFLLLADIAAAYDVPIDLHMEALPRDLARPQGLSDANPGTLVANIARFERLLAHNPKARIVWAHAGWDNTGERTPVLMRRLLQAHPNLFMSLKIAGGTSKGTRPVKRGKKLKASWQELFRLFPGRFMIGTDLKYRGDGKTRGGGPKVYRRILKALPAEIAEMIAHRNARRVFKLGP